MHNVVPNMPTHTKEQNITKDKLQRHLPKGSGHKVTDEILKMINQVEHDTGLEQQFMEEQILSNMNIVKDLKISLSAYVDAVKYCTLKQNMSNRKAWEIVFPERLDKVTKLAEARAAEGRENSVNIDSHVSNYNNTEAVAKISAQLMVAVHIQYAPMFHASIKKQFDLMNGVGARPNDNVSAHVQLNAAISLAELTKMPEDNKIELQIGISDEAKSVQKGLTAQLARLADSQMARLANGEGIETVQKIGINTDAIVEADIDE